MHEKDYLSIIASNEVYLEKYGDHFLGVGWTKTQEHVDRRYQVMLDVIKPNAPRPVRLLDFGCGASHLYEYMLRQRILHIHYSGLDLSKKFMALSRRKFPQVTYYELDILDDSADLPQFDYIVVNGVFTYKSQLTFDAMLDYKQRLVSKIFTYARYGIAFNVMSKQVDWERDDLFHLPMDTLATFLSKHVSRDFVIRHDYGLYEYTVYVYRPGVSYET